MKTEFTNWMVRFENKSQNTAYQYAQSIDKISRHHSEMTKEYYDLYTSTDLLKIKGIAVEYGIGGKYSDFGNYGNGTVRNAIATYVRFLEKKNIGKEINKIDSDDIELMKETNQALKENNLNGINFTYERDLQSSLILQAEQLFPSYRIFGQNKEGIEYNIEGKRIDLLLEHKSEDKLLVTELKAGVADFKVFGQISMYLGLLSKKYPEKEINGVIIASEIDESLINATLTTKRITLKTYKMQLMLEEI
ncbi:hypothetical protein Selin_2377 [Desulfurispirillum indicum S5]|uniref:Endonuclease NucS C-terminal domain-containing protein n=1 Tax=Desulfurispirillum indicum (strain ATCC BAA-1389 / DSM 22839 / S5) TaxID=653733 RepID=E6W4L9_DESIS|nr:endonuclease NucS domain-containing protein [Desulfurispirillum indicum]ADU67092.1 hypothetical protein Selin_2377 [Desulfurispirillum indicum S5]